jgi:hypothetical protein
LHAERVAIGGRLDAQALTLYGENAALEEHRCGLLDDDALSACRQVLRARGLCGHHLAAVAGKRE